MTAAGVVVITWWQNIPLEMDRTTSQLANISQKLANEFQLTTDKFHGGQLSLLLKLLITREDTCCAY